jgi:hypothetical protein
MDNLRLPAQDGWMRQIIAQIPEGYRGMANDLINTVANVYPSDVVALILSGLATGVVSTQLPFAVQPVAHALTNAIINKGSDIYKKDAYQKAYESIDKAKLESTDKNEKKLVRTLAPTAPEDRSQIFPGFETLAHTALIGSTNSGKTTLLTSYLYNIADKNIMPEFDQFILIGSDYMNNEKIQPIRRAVMWNLLENKKPYQEDVFAYFKASQINDAVAMVSSANTDKKRIMFFDDIQISNHAQSLGNFAQQAKNFNCSLFISMHVAYSKNTEIMIRGACRYYILLNQNENTFNRLTEQKVGNSLWRQYNLIEDKYERVLIYDTETKKAYAGVNKFHLLNPLVNTIENEKDN